MNEIDLVLSLLPSLNPKEKQKVKDALGVTAPVLTPCQKDGHKLVKVMEKQGVFFFWRTTATLVCSKCGHSVSVCR